MKDEPISDKDNDDDQSEYTVSDSTDTPDLTGHQPGNDFLADQDELSLECNENVGGISKEDMNKTKDAEEKISNKEEDSLKEVVQDNEVIIIYNIPIL